MDRYIIVKKETIEKIWKITAETHNEAVDKFASIKKEDAAFLDEDDMTGVDMVKDYDDWQVYKKIDMQSGVKKYVLMKDRPK